uniref:Uncharacterized protein n=1 Tax=Aegilops tauschii subsp. strangulata TaxID=200361 RepID=A0A453KKI6_AEGTS
MRGQQRDSEVATLNSRRPSYPFRSISSSRAQGQSSSNVRCPTTRVISLPAATFWQHLRMVSSKGICCMLTKVVRCFQVVVYMMHTYT